MLALLGTLAHEQPSLRVQTHIAENHAELALVRELYPAHRDYASVYDSAGLLTPRTVLAHTIHLSDAEVALIKERGCGVAHCPVSNTALASGICPVRKLLDRGIKVGLGTDVSGGCSCSILVAMREACGVSRLLAAMEKEDDDGRREKCKLSVLEALWLATRGGAEVMGLGDKVGAFEVGMEWDAQVIRVVKVPKGGESTTTGEDMKIGKPGVDEGLVELWSNEDWEEKISKWVYCGDDRNTRKVWVRGRCVYER